MTKLVYGIDVGTSKIATIAGRVIDGRRGWAEVVSVGEAPSHGLRRGMVVDREAATESVAEAIEACGGVLRGGRGSEVSVGIAGGHISSYNTEITLLNRSRDRMVTERFVKRLETEARQAAFEEDESVIHVIPRSFVLDGAEGVRQPVGLAARRVTMRAHVVSGVISTIQNLLGAVEDCGVRVSRVVLEPLASSEACLLDEDRNLGVALIDIGGGTTDIAAFMRGSLTHTAVIPIGGQSFSADVAYGLKVPFEAADQLKLRYGTVISREIDDVAAVKLGDKHYNARFVSQILEYRAREVLEYARDSLDEAGVRDLLPGGAVLTGGGSLLEGMDELAEKILGMPTKIATPRRLKGDSEPVRKPQYSTAVGLLYFSAKNDDLGPKSKGARATSFGSIVTAVKEWFGFGV
ncbi:MAG: Cell division protein FtsA [uncultured Rubrobacteraceae bacterium]|uniref:Cell division protein FtsA n=1 Tax=uncultured Rubrobacteraceae bacterium TaxID=349277 RepID=A0A6J4QNT9_9ACTN|nr:MAG: Cell division protein FtsA [uncultured Rubrobacteraceae bacterium]